MRHSSPILPLPYLYCISFFLFCSFTTFDNCQCGEDQPHSVESSIQRGTTERSGVVILNHAILLTSWSSTLSTILPPHRSFRTALFCLDGRIDLNPLKITRKGTLSLTLLSFLPLSSISALTSLRSCVLEDYAGDLGNHVDRRRPSVWLVVILSFCTGNYKDT
jgi:hypothetical protein